MFCVLICVLITVARGQRPPTTGRKSARDVAESIDKYRIERNLSTEIFTLGTSLQLMTVQLLNAAKHL